MSLDKKIKVMVVDDSATVRQTFLKMLSSEKFIQSVEVASDPLFAIEKMRKDWPDVIILDIEMPRMDGITFLKQIMEDHPTPVLICSSLTGAGTETAMHALSLGAVEIITKPQVGVGNFIEESREQFFETIKAAASSRPAVQYKQGAELLDKSKFMKSVLEKEKTHASVYKTTDKIIAIGASTGGTIALETILKDLSPDLPGIVIVQHMPEKFTKAFADRLNTICEIEVKEAENGDRVLSGRALIAPGNFHMKLIRSGGHYEVEVKSGPIINHHRPSVDVLFRSVAKNAGNNAFGIMLTGMGDDGASAMLEMKNEGAYNIAQDESSSVVWGMPGEAYKRGAVEELVPLSKISEKIKNTFK